eukprot:376769-Amphidinium_carterae.2
MAGLASHKRQIHTGEILARKMRGSRCECCGSNLQRRKHLVVHVARLARCSAFYQALPDLSAEDYQQELKCSKMTPAPRVDPPMRGPKKRLGDEVFTVPVDPWIFDPDSVGTL